MAKIGTLSADLSLESANFIRDLKKAADATARNMSAMQRQIAGIQKGFASAAASFKGFAAGFVSVAAVRQFANIAKAAIQVGDEISEAATKIGVSGDALQRFRFAAQQADVSVEQLDGALKIFQKNIAAGKISNEGFEQFIQRIREAPTQIDKVRVAQQGLGREFQTGLLLAAESGEAFRRNFERAFVVSDKALSVASQLDNAFKDFNDALKAGFTTGFLEGLSGKLGASSEQLERMNRVSKDLGKIAANELQTVASVVERLAAVGDTGSISKLAAGFLDMSAVKITEGSVLAYFRDIVLPAWEKFSAFMNFKPAAFIPNTPFAVPGEAGAGAGISAGASGIAAIGSAAESSTGSLGKLTAGLNAAAVAAADLGAKQKASLAQTADGYADIASTISGNLAQAFNDNKGFAIANAVVNTAAGITKAFADPKLLFPADFAVAASIAAAGAAQIATISSAQMGSSKRPSVGGGRGRGGGIPDAGASSSGASTTVAPALQRALSIHLHGSNYSAQAVRDLIAQINEQVKDGVTLITTT